MSAAPTLQVVTSPSLDVLWPKEADTVWSHSHCDHRVAVQVHLIGLEAGMGTGLKLGVEFLVLNLAWRFFFGGGVILEVLAAGVQMLPALSARSWSGVGLGQDDWLLWKPESPGWSQGLPTS